MKNKIAQHISVVRIENEQAWRTEDSGLAWSEFQRTAVIQGGASRLPALKASEFVGDAGCGNRCPIGCNKPLTDAEDIAIALADKFPDTDPLTVRFTDLYKWVVSLEGFSDDPKNSNEKKLEAIQMAWHEEWQDRQQ